MICCWGRSCPREWGSQGGVGASLKQCAVQVLGREPVVTDRWGGSSVFCFGGGFVLAGCCCRRAGAVVLGAGGGAVVGAGAGGGTAATGLHLVRFGAPGPPSAAQRPKLRARSSGLPTKSSAPSSGPMRLAGAAPWAEAELANASAAPATSAKMQSRLMVSFPFELLWVLVLWTGANSAV